MILSSEQETADLAAAIAKLVKPGDVIALGGGLGVGKTTFARALIHALGHEGEVPSPSFAIVQPYEALPIPVWHADLYRIEDPSDLIELGLEQADEGLLVVEWAERAGPGSWPEALRLTLEIAGEGSRALTAEVPAAWEERWPPQ